MAEESSEVNELYGRGLGGKLWVMNGRLVKKEIKKEEEKSQKNIGDGIDEEEMVSGGTGSGKGTDANSIPDHPSQPCSVIHPRINHPQLSVKVEEEQATGESIAEELQQLRAMAVENERALKDKQLLNEMLMAKLEEVRKEKKSVEEQLKAEIDRVREENSHQFDELKRQLIEDQQKIEQLTAELETEKEKSNMDKETPVAVTALQPSRSIVAAQLLGIDVQLLEEPQPNEWKEKLDQLNIKYLKVKRLYRTERKVAGKLRQKLEDKKKDATMEGEEEKQYPGPLGDADHQAQRIESSEAVSSPPFQSEQLLGLQIDVEEEEEDGEEDGSRMQKEARAKATYLRRRRQLTSGGNGGRKALPTTMRKETKKKKSDAATNTLATVPAAAAGVFKCAQCPADKVAFSSLEQLGKHQQRQHGDRRRYRHQCQECGQSFPYHSNLQQHMRIHSGKRPFTCQECGRRFGQQSRLNVHKRLHTGERPYICRVCKKAFADSSHLIRHARAHSGATPFSCQHCARQFNDSSHCRRHEKICSLIRGTPRPTASDD